MAISDYPGNQIAAYHFEYDSLGRLIRSTEYGAGDTITQRTEHLYDAYNRLSAQSWVVQGDSFTESYTYNDPDPNNPNALKDGSLKSMTTATGDSIYYNYDGLKRLESTSIKNSSGTTLFRTGYGYKAGALANQTTTRVGVYTTWNPDYTSIFSYRYEYDAVSNITQVKDATNSNRLLTEYTYDVQNQLTQEVIYVYDSDGNATTATYAYTYDTAGNILTESKDGVVSKTYTYGNGDWNDLLTEYNGQKIAYEGQVYSETKNRLGVVTATSVTGTPTSGNPISYYNGVRWTLDWEQGRNLKQNYNFSTNSLVESTSKVDTETTLNYSYDLDGIRTNKTYVVKKYGYSPSSGGGVVASIGENALVPNATSYVRYLLSTSTVEHNYVTQNGKVVRETIGSGATAKVLDFIYDASERPFALKYKNGTAATQTYYYVLNLQGDVVALMTADRSIVAEYTYNAWGEVLTATGTMASINPLRYRGYYYDTETGFYYLQSRYYDPVMHRFINADSYASTGQGFVGTNMFAYCNNCTVICADYAGCDAIIVTNDGLAGHLGILVQDKDGKWYHFYWGSSDGSSSSSSSSSNSNVGSLWGTDAKTWCDLYVGELTLDAINSSGQYNGGYDRMTYLTGDFSSCLAEMNNTTGEYNLFTNNCSQKSLRILASANTKYSQILTDSAGIWRPEAAHDYLIKQINKMEYGHMLYFILRSCAPHAGSLTSFGVKE